jgi:hypothetical protein
MKSGWLPLVLILISRAAATEGRLGIEITSANPWSCLTASELAANGGRLHLKITLENRGDAAVDARYAMHANDFWGRPVALDPIAGHAALPARGKALVEADLRPGATGAFDIEIRVEAGGQRAERSFTVAVVPDPHEGIRPRSFFASNVGPWEDAPFWARVGVKVARRHWAWEGASALEWTEARQPADPIRFDFTGQDRQLAELQELGLSVLGIVGYAGPEWARSPEARRLNVYGPPRDDDEFIRATVPVVEHFRQIPVWELWNEPWAHGWTWAAGAEEYRRLQRAWLQAARRARPDVEVIAGSSASFLADHVAGHPESFRGLLDGDTNHPYQDFTAPTLRSGAELRYLDYGVQLGRQMGLARHYVTEDGTDVGQLSGSHDDPRNAAKLVQLHVLAALAGAFQGDVQEGLGWGPTQLRGAAAYATMTHLLEDRVVVRDLWPGHPLIFGALFASPDLGRPDVERADALSARWKVSAPVDEVKVAIVWSWLGPSAEQLDRQATLTLEDAADIRAYDLMGGELPRRSDGTLSVPFSSEPVYLASRALSTDELARRIRDARLERVTPVSLSLEPLTAAPDERPDLVVRLQNQLNRRLEGSLSVSAPPGWERQEDGAAIVLAPAELREVHVRWLKARLDAENRYPFEVRWQSAGDSEVAVKQVVQVARLERRRIRVDGNLADWSGAVPVRMEAAGEPRIAVSAYGALDARSLYAAFVVEEPELTPRANAFAGDAITFALGLNERASDDFHGVGDPWRWKGMFRDTDSQYVISGGPDGARVRCLVRPGRPFRLSDEARDRIDTRGRVAVTRDESQRRTIYEVAIPLAELGLTATRREQLRFGFVLFAAERHEPLEWSAAAGVFDFWRNHGSFLPSWLPLLPAQTPWGIARQ